MPKQSGYWWVYYRVFANSEPELMVVMYWADTDSVEEIGSYGSSPSQNYEFIRPCLFEHDTNREQCVRDCLGQ